MIKAVMTAEDGRPILIFGLTDLNLDRLRIRGEFIHFELGELGISPSIPVYIMGGQDENAIRAYLSEHFTMPWERPSVEDDS